MTSQPVDLYRFTAKYGPNVEFPFILSQPVDLYRWTAKYGRGRKCQNYGDVYRLTDIHISKFVIFTQPVDVYRLMDNFQQ